MPDPAPLMDSAEDLLTPGEVARLFRVDPKTVARWEKDGRLTSVKTLGGHRRYPRTQINHVIDTASPRERVLDALEGARQVATDHRDDVGAEQIAHLITTLRETS